MHICCLYLLSAICCCLLVIYLFFLKDKSKKSISTLNTITKYFREKVANVVMRDIEIELDKMNFLEIKSS